MKTALGITKAKRRFAKATGIPTTKSGRKRKAMNAITGGAYGRYQKTRAAINRPYKYMKNPPTPLGCLVYALCMVIMLMLLPVLLI